MKYILFLTAGFACHLFCIGQMEVHPVSDREALIGLNVDSIYTNAKIKEQSAQWKEAIESYETVIFLLKNDSITDDGLLEETLKHISTLYHEIEDYPKAISYIKKYGDEVKNRNGLKSIEYALALNNIAAYYHEIGNNRDAISNGKAALSIADSLGLYNNLLYAGICTNLAVAYSNHYVDSAELMFDNAINTMVRCKKGESLEMGIIQGDYAAFLSNNGLDSLKAASLYQSAQNIIKRNVGEKHSQYSNILQKIATFYRISNPEIGIKYDIKATKIQKTIYGENSIQYANALYFLAYDYSLIDAYSGNNTNIHQSDVYNCLKKAHIIHRNYLDKGLCELNSVDREYLWNEYHSLRVLLPLLCIAYESDDMNSLLYDDLLFSKNLLLRIDRDFKTNLLRTNDHKKVNSFGDTISWKDIQKKMTYDDIAIEFGMYETDTNHYYALLLSKKMNAPMFIPLFSEEELFSLSGDSLFFRWEPILEEVNGCKNVYFSPDGILNIYPLERILSIIPDLKSKDINIYRLSSTANIIRPSPNNNIKKAILYGGLDYFNKSKENDSTVLFNNNNITGAPTYSISNIRSSSNRSGFDFLNNSLSEVQDINDLLKKNKIESKLLTGDHGTESSFLSISGNHVDLIHIATHGAYVLSDGPLQSFMRYDNNRKSVEEEALDRSLLVLSGANMILQKDSISLGQDDGILTAHEISKLNLQYVDMVVLSACETGIGAISYNGVYGLQRGFKKAGVNTILMSLNKVDDEATKILMVEFYKNLMTGKTKQQSLKDAQKYLRKVDNGKYDDPKYWASFIMLDGLN